MTAQTSRLKLRIVVGVVGDSSSDRQALEDLWRERLHDARLRLDFARNYTKEVQRDVVDGAVQSADGAFANQRALRAENVALDRYRRTLQIYSDLVLHGEIPDESEWSQAKPPQSGGKRSTGTTD